MSGIKQEHRIRKDQQKYLDSLICQRIREDAANQDFIQKLRNGWNTEKKGKMVFYVVKDPQLGVPMFFFSLRCGEVNTPLDLKKQNKTAINAIMLLKEARNACGGLYVPPMTWEQEKLAQTALDLFGAIDVEDWAKEVIKKQMVNGKLPWDAWMKIWKRVLAKMDKASYIKFDELMEKGNIIRTENSYAAVELVHFCTYDPVHWEHYRDLSREDKKRIKLEQNCVARKWHDQGMDAQSMGRAIFWKFVEPAIQEIRDIVGCEYVYLFAADNSGGRDGQLIRLYQDLGFDFRTDLHVTKPFYDFKCYFMCQEVTSLRNGKNAFFRDYNKLPEQPKNN